MTEVVTLEFDADDNPVIKVEGVKGKSCTQLTEALEKKLGTVTKDEKTSEYNEREINGSSRVHNRR